MALAYYVDEHVPKAITVALRARGVDVLTVLEDGRKTEDDDLLLARARELKRVMVSQDKDFLRIVRRWLGQGRTFAGVVYGQQWAASIGAYVEDLHLLAVTLEPVDMENNVQYLPL